MIFILNFTIFLSLPIFITKEITMITRKRKFREVSDETKEKICTSTMRNFSFFRVASQHFAYSYNILHGSYEDRHEVAQLRFARHGERQEGTMYGFLHIANSVLFDHPTLSMVLRLPEEMRMVFHNITAIDLAKDFTTINPVSIIRRLYKDKTVTTIINGKAAKDPK